MSAASAEFEFLVEPSAELMCLICTTAFKDPVELQPCGHHYCRRCIANVTECPTCRRPIASRKKANRIICNLVDELKMRCTGCGWEGTREATALHTGCGAPPVVAAYDAPDVFDVTPDIPNGAALALLRRLADSTGFADWDDATVATARDGLLLAVPHATTSECVAVSLEALTHLCKDCGTHRRALFTTDAVRGAMVQLARRVASADGVVWLGKAIEAMSYSEAAADHLGTAELRDALMCVVPHVTTSECCGWFWNAIRALTHHSDAVCTTLGTAALRDAWVNLAPLAINSLSIDPFCASLQNLCLMSSNQDTFGTTEVRDALLNMLPFFETGFEVICWCDAIGCLVAGHARNRRLFGTVEVRNAFIRLAPRAYSPRVVDSLCTAISAHIVDDIVVDVSNCRLFCTDAVRDVLVNLAPNATDRDSVLWLCRVLLNLMMHDAGGVVFATVAVRALVVELSRFVTQQHADASDVELTTSMVDVFRYATQSTSGCALYNTEAVRDALVCLSRFATSHDSVASLCRAVDHLITINEDHCTLFATEALFDAVLRMTEHATTSECVMLLCRVMGNLASANGGGSRMLFVSVAVRDALVRMAARAASSDCVEQLSRAVCHLTATENGSFRKWIGGAARRSLSERVTTQVRQAARQLVLVLRGGASDRGKISDVFGTATMRDALAGLMPHAATVSSALWLSDAMQRVVHLNPDLRAGMNGGA